MGRRARQRAWCAWRRLLDELRESADEAPSRPRRVDLGRVVHGMGEILADIDETRLSRAAARDAESLDDVHRQRELVEAVIEEIGNAGPARLPDWVYFAVDGFDQGSALDPDGGGCAAAR